VNGGVGAVADKHLPWQNVCNQDLLGTEYIEIDPSNKVDLDGDKSPTQTDFEHLATKPVLFGPMTKFFISGCFDVKKDAAADWAAAVAVDLADVVLQYNWFKMLIKSVDVFHNNQHIASSNKQRFIYTYLHTMLYAYMDLASKKFLCPQKAHPAYCILEEKNQWTVASKSWKDYAAHFFGAKPIAINFFPLFQFPFYLGSNFITDSVLRILPVDHQRKMHVCFTFFDKKDHIF
jgi:hypothetical protein